MQDYKKYNYALTPEDIKRALKTGQHVTVIINGEYYDVKPGKDTSK